MQRGWGDAISNGVRIEEVGPPDRVRAQWPSPPAGRWRPGVSASVQARGKFLFLGEEKRYLRGVTYGTFRPTAGGDYGAPEMVERDFAAMAAHGIDTVRTYSAPPRWLLDAATRHGISVLVGLAWEQHIAFLEGSDRPRAIIERVRADARRCAGHPAVLGYTIGNEIPVGIVRWFGRRRIERFLKRLYTAVKAEDPDALVTYVNYPSTEYLQLPFLDFVAFNVYLEHEASFSAYLARLQNIAGDRPLIVSEIGLDSARNGESGQACAITSQIRSAFTAGCAGTFVFQWTDEWFRGGNEVTDWDFGVTSRAREPKLALAALTESYAAVPFRASEAYPRFSVIVCSYNGARTLDECCAGLRALNYPDFDVIVVDDGSTDETAAIAASYGYRVIRLANGGLSRARNAGLAAATGEFVAYLDADAWPDPDWLTYLHATFTRTAHVGIGGPNIAPPNDGIAARAVAHAPGGPIHVLLSDQEAEHIPGCNMAFRRSALEAIGGFDPQFRVAGDDVDVCWRLQKQGWTLGFSPAAVVWHHRRDTIGRYWRQQIGYGKAEALLERIWPEKYNLVGHLTWSGRMYGAKVTYLLRRVERIYQGQWGSALFQSLDQAAPGPFAALPQIPEWYLLVIALMLSTTLSVQWPLVALGSSLLLLFAVTMTLLYAAIGSARSLESSPTVDSWSQKKVRALTALLFMIQPLARLIGRARNGLTPWRSHIHIPWVAPVRRRCEIWSEDWYAPDRWLEHVEEHLAQRKLKVSRGGDYDRWDLKVSRGIFGSAFTRMVVEEHAEGTQLARFGIWPHCSVSAALLVFVCASLDILAAAHAERTSVIVLSSAVALLIVRIVRECGTAVGAIWASVSQTKEPSRDAPPCAPSKDIHHPKTARALPASRRYEPFVRVDADGN
jgi:O-antigen biosynthesis protein